VKQQVHAKTHNRIPDCGDLGKERTSRIFRFFFLPIWIISVTLILVFLGGALAKVFAAYYPVMPARAAAFIKAILLAAFLVPVIYFAILKPFRKDLRTLETQKRDVCRSRDRLMTVFDNINSAVCVADLDTYAIIYANRFMNEHYGDVESKRWWEVLEADEFIYQGQSSSAEAVETANEREGALSWEYRSRINGRWYEAGLRIIEWIDGTPVQLVVSSDITKRKELEEERESRQINLADLVRERTEELDLMIARLENEIHKREIYERALWDTEMLFSQIFSQDDDALIILSAEDRKIMDINVSSTELFGCSKTEMTSHGISAFFSQDELDLFEEALNSARKEETVLIPKMEVLKKEGNRKIVSFRCRFVRMFDRDIFFCSFRDITKRVRAEEEKNTLHAKLIQANKMASLGMLVSGVAHEVNNPNNFIMFNSELVLDAWNDIQRILEQYKENGEDVSIGGLPLAEMTEAIPKLLNGISDGSHRIKKIVEDLRSFAKKDVSSIDEVVDVSKIVSAAVSVVQYDVKRHTDHFRVNIEQVPHIRGNAQQIEQALINLLINALQALEDRDRKVSLDVSYDENMNEVIIKVRDEGAGMSKEILEHVTDPFFSTKLDKGGTGLGLSITKSIVKDHKGSITFRSEQGKGTTATIRLPAIREEATIV